MTSKTKESIKVDPPSKPQLRVVEGEEKGWSFLCGKTGVVPINHIVDEGTKNVLTKIGKKCDSYIDFIMHVVKFVIRTMIQSEISLKENPKNNGVKEFLQEIMEVHVSYYEACLEYQDQINYWTDLSDIKGGPHIPSLKTRRCEGCANQLEKNKFMLRYWKAFNPICKRCMVRRVCAYCCKFSFKKNEDIDKYDDGSLYNIVTTKSEKTEVEVFNCCTRCEVMHYCSEECQKKDWKRHKIECKGDWDTIRRDTLTAILGSRPPLSEEGMKCFLCSKDKSSDIEDVRILYCGYLEAVGCMRCYAVFMNIVGFVPLPSFLLKFSYYKDMIAHKSREKKVDSGMPFWKRS